jgi:hypothetical protein
MADDLATIDQVVSLGRPLSDAENNLALAWLPVASAIIRARLGTVDARLADGTLSSDLVAYVVAQMIVSALDRPGAGVTQRSETVGPISRSESYDKANTAGLGLTDAWLAMLLPAVSATAGIGSIRLGLPTYLQRPIHPEPTWVTVAQPDSVDVDGGFLG